MYNGDNVWPTRPYNICEVVLSLEPLVATFDDSKCLTLNYAVGTEVLGVSAIIHVVKSCYPEPAHRGILRYDFFVFLAGAMIKLNFRRVSLYMVRSNSWILSEDLHEEDGKIARILFLTLEVSSTKLNDGYMRIHWHEERTGRRFVSKHPLRCVPRKARRPKMAICPCSRRAILGTNVARHKKSARHLAWKARKQRMMVAAAANALSV